jgi:hypothetical protein
MNDEKFILDYLNTYYDVVYSDIHPMGGFFVGDKESEKVVGNISSFTQHFKLIFSNYRINKSLTSVELMHRWFNERKDLKIRSLDVYIDKVINKTNSDRLVTNAIKRFGNPKKFFDYLGENIVKKHVNEVYFDRITKPELDLVIEKYKNLKYITSQALYNEVSQEKPGENEHIKGLTRDFICKWYCDNFLDDKLNDMYGQLVITMGRTNWVVTWIGHGKMDVYRFLEQFRGEIPNVVAVVKVRYEKWYMDSITEATERIMNQPFNNQPQNYIYNNKVYSTKFDEHGPEINLDL